MSVTLKKRIIKEAQRFTKRNKRNHNKHKDKYKSYLSRLVSCCVNTDCLEVYLYNIDPCTDYISDIYFKDVANERYDTLEEIFLSGSMSKQTFEYMMLGYTCLIESKNRDALMFFNEALHYV